MTIADEIIRQSRSSDRVESDVSEISSSTPSNGAKLSSNENVGESSSTSTLLDQSGGLKLGIYTDKSKGHQYHNRRHILDVYKTPADEYAAVTSGRVKFASIGQITCQSPFLMHVRKMLERIAAGLYRRNTLTSQKVADLVRIGKQKTPVVSSSYKKKDSDSGLIAPKVVQFLENTHTDQVIIQASEDNDLSLIYMDLVDDMDRYNIQEYYVACIALAMIESKPSMRVNYMQLPVPMYKLFSMLNVPELDSLEDLIDGDYLKPYPSAMDSVSHWRRGYETFFDNPLDYLQFSLPFVNKAYFKYRLIQYDANDVEIKLSPTHVVTQLTIPSGKYVDLDENSITPLCLALVKSEPRLVLAPNAARLRFTNPTVYNHRIPLIPMNGIKPGSSMVVVGTKGSFKSLIFKTLPSKSLSRPHFVSESVAIDSDEFGEHMAALFDIKLVMIDGKYEFQATLKPDVDEEKIKSEGWSWALENYPSDGHTSLIDQAAEIVTSSFTSSPEGVGNDRTYTSAAAIALTSFYVKFLNGFDTGLNFRNFISGVVAKLCPNCTQAPFITIMVHSSAESGMVLASSKVISINPVLDPKYVIKGRAKNEDIAGSCMLSDMYSGIRHQMISLSPLDALDVIQNYHTATSGGKVQLDELATNLVFLRNNDDYDWKDMFASPYKRGLISQAEGNTGWIDHTTTSIFKSNEVEFPPLPTSSAEAVKEEETEDKTTKKRPRATRKRRTTRVIKRSALSN